MRVQIAVTVEEETRRIVQEEAKRYTMVGNMSDYVERAILEKYARDKADRERAEREEVEARR